MSFNSIFNDIFGGTQTPATSQSSSTPMNMNPFTSPLSGTVINMGNTPVPQFTGSTQPNITGAANATLGTIPGMEGGPSGVNSFLNSLMGGSFLPGGSNFNPFVQSLSNAAISPIMENLQQTVGRILPGQFTAAGQFVQNNANNGGGFTGGSSAFDNAVALAGTGAANAAAQVTQGIANNAYNTGVGATMQAVPLQQQEVQTTINALQAQTLPTLIQQQGIQNGLQAFQENTQALLTFLQSVGQLAMPVVANQQQSTSTGESTTKGIVPALVGMFKPSGGGGGGSG